MKKLLIVVDYQNDFVDGALGFTGAELLDEGVAKKVREYGEDKDSLVYLTLDTHHSDYLNTREGKKLPIEHCIKGTEGWKVYGETKKALMEVEALQLEKYTFGVSLDTYGVLLPDKVESVELIGLVTNMCVISNAVVFQARYPEAQIIVDASLCGSFDKEMHEKALDVMESMYIKIINRVKTNKMK